MGRELEGYLAAKSARVAELEADRAEIEGIRMREGRGYRQEEVSLVKPYGTVNVPVLKH